MSIIFITGIDTGSGKTMATGLIARYLRKQNKSVITQKIVQTGGDKISEDIRTHRKIMGMELNEDDKSGLTCPYIFKYRASPHLAARLENKTIDIDLISNTTKKLTEKYETVLIEGVGGIYVPLDRNSDITLLDYIEMHNYTIILVTTSKLGSINHTLLTLDAIKNRDLDLHGLIYNHYPVQDDAIIQDTKDVIEKYLSQNWFNAFMIDIPAFNMNSVPDIDFSALL